ncbi:hypothetical protein EKE94_12885 [Mesobaculum littorinae]|uniref:Uncharacterized protein n=1 Tax=Mesobaculum littorinae TaxID=2486419 RepID=A0A438AFF2_9RHOB|nr:hypothetical protein [Mesobaculum littorinae]RVV97441.1 hypothetical protein EKE94_12885 [Mesobaculum littorinae]
MSALTGMPSRVGCDRGAAPVGALAAWPDADARLVRWLRQWCDGPEGQAAVWDEMSTALSPSAAQGGITALQDLLQLIMQAGRRPLMRHAATCDCVGSDEAVFANFVMTAATGDREEAMLMAALLVRADRMAEAAYLAQTLGLAARRIGLRLRPGIPRPTHMSPTTH